MQASMKQKRPKAVLYLRPYYNDLGKLQWFVKRFLSKRKFEVVETFIDEKDADKKGCPELARAAQRIESDPEIQLFLTVGSAIDAPWKYQAEKRSDQLRAKLRELNKSYAAIQTSGWGVAGYVAETWDNRFGDGDNWSDLPIPPAPTKQKIAGIKKQVLANLQASNGEVNFLALTKSIKDASGQFIYEVASNCVAAAGLSEAFIIALRELEQEKLIHIAEVHWAELPYKPNLPIADSPGALTGNLIQPYWFPCVIRSGPSPEQKRKKLDQKPNGNAEWRKKDYQSGPEYRRSPPKRS